MKGKNLVPEAKYLTKENLCLSLPSKSIDELKTFPKSKSTPSSMRHLVKYKEMNYLLKKKLVKYIFDSTEDVYLKDILKFDKPKKLVKSKKSKKLLDNSKKPKEYVGFIHSINFARFICERLKEEGYEIILEDDGKVKLLSSTKGDIWLSLPPKTVDELKDFAKSQGLNVSDFLKILITKAITGENEPQLYELKKSIAKFIKEPTVDDFRTKYDFYRDMIDKEEEVRKLEQEQIAIMEDERLKKAQEEYENSMYGQEKVWNKLTTNDKSLMHYYMNQYKISFYDAFEKLKQQEARDVKRGKKKNP